MTRRPSRPVLSRPVPSRPCSFPRPRTMPHASLHSACPSAIDHQIHAVSETGPSYRGHFRMRHYQILGAQWEMLRNGPRAGERQGWGGKAGTLCRANVLGPGDSCSWFTAHDRGGSRSGASGVCIDVSVLRRRAGSENHKVQAHTVQGRVEENGGRGRAGSAQRTVHSQLELEERLLRLGCRCRGGRRPEGALERLLAHLCVVFLRGHEVAAPLTMS